MSNDNFFVPNILICGDVAEFLSRVQQRPFKIVGQIIFFGNVDGQEFNFFKDGRFSIDGKIYNINDLLQILNRGGVNFIVFNDGILLQKICGFLKNIGLARSQLVTAREFQFLPYDNFYDVYSDVQLLIFLKKSHFKNLLDFDGHFVKSQVMTSDFNDFTKIDCVYENDFFTMKQNIFSRIYKKFSNCCLKHYDAVLIEERTPNKFISTFLELKNSSDTIITFTKRNSELSRYISTNLNNFRSVDVIKSFAGEWLICYRHKPPEDFAMYVVTHKKLPNEYVENFPEGYRVIHAGRELSQDLGYIGDNTGDNISYLNPYINEMTAFYWIWKNTAHTIIGFSHYRRFFTEYDEHPFYQINDHNFHHSKILTKKSALNLLESYDIIISRLACHDAPQFEDITLSVGEELSEIAKTIIKKNLINLYPEYEDSFNYVINSPTYYECHMFITRRNIFDNYCKWLFSFALETLQEFMQIVPLNKFSKTQKRTVGFFIERMFTVWLLKNNLNVKEINKMFVIGI